MGGRNRWAYMAAPGFNPPNNDCPECEGPSKTYFIGAKTVMEKHDGKEEAVCVTRYQCEHRHKWTTREIR